MLSIYYSEENMGGRVYASESAGAILIEQLLKTQGIFPTMINQCDNSVNPVDSKQSLS